MNIADAVLKRISIEKGHISVLIQELEDTPICSINADDAFSSASVIKTAIMRAVLKAVEDGSLSLADALSAKKGAILSDCICFPAPREVSVIESLNWMIRISDNTSTNLLIKRLGMDRINAAAAELGMSKTILSRMMLDFGAIERGFNNITSNRDTFMLFKSFFRNEGLRSDLCGLALEILKGQRDKQKLTRYIWESDAVFYHKTGGLDYLCHDAGVMALNGKIVYIGVFAEQCCDIDGYPDMIGDIGRIVYDYFKGGAE
jgi:beta-lactamase class A